MRCTCWGFRSFRACSPSTRIPTPASTFTRGAVIGDHFAIDHGTGIVIGETSIIGSHVTLYQGVTLGARNFTYDKDGKPLNLPRHPILEDGVTVYSNSSILGRVTIGKDSVIGGNVWLTRSVPEKFRILQGKTQDFAFSDGAGI